MMDQLTTMAAVLARTETLQVASSVVIAPYRHPLSIAHEFATIDQLSEGRVMMGVGCGWSEAEFLGLGLDTFANRNEVTDECIDIYRLSWGEDVLEYHGEFFDFEELSMDPKPYGGRQIPIYAGGTFKIAARRAVRKCDGFYPMLLDSPARPSRFVPLIEEMKRTADKIDRDMSDFELLAMCSALITDADDPITEKDYILTGSAEQVLEQIQEFADHGYSHLTLHFDVRDGGGAELFEIVERFAEEVLPEAAKIKHTPAF
jgi:probable F420-dependent oxidoreductase